MQKHNLAALSGRLFAPALENRLWADDDSSRVTGSTKSLAQHSAKYLVSASACAMALFWAGGAMAQSGNIIPPECIVDPSPLASGSTITCIAAAPDEIGPIVANVDDLTIVVGDENTPTTVNNPNGIAIKLDGGGLQSVEVSGALSRAEIIDLSGVGVSLTPFAGSNSLEGSESAVTGATFGIYQRTNGGDALIQNLGSVTGQSGNAIDVASRGGAITIANIGTISGIGGNGINAVADGGDISIQGSGLVGGIAGTGGDGIFADSGGGNISIGGAVALGAVTGSRHGIFTTLSGGDGDISINALSVTGGEAAGVSVNNRGTGSIDLAVTDANSSDASAIGISNSGGDVNITSSGEILAMYGGRGTGVSVSNRGSGFVDINVNNVTSEGGEGISVSSTIQRDGPAVNITATGDISSLFTGVSVRNRGRGDTNIDVNNVFAPNENAIDIDHGFYAGDVNIITRGVVDGGDSRGIFVENNGASSIDIKSYGNVSGSEGISVVNNNSGFFVPNPGLDVSILSTADVTSIFSGIVSVNRGAGSTTISANNVSGRIFAGILARTGALADDVTITSTGEVSGGREAIKVENDGRGDTNISILGNVYGGSFGVVSETAIGATTITLGTSTVIEGQEDAGVMATSTGALANITVQGSSGSIIGATNGLYVNTMGADILIRNLDSVSGGSGNGIDAASNGGDISIQNIGSVTAGGNQAIIADTRSGPIGGIINIGGDGAIGDVTNSGSGDGILAFADYGGSIEIAVNNVTSNRQGIIGILGQSIFDGGNGGISITSTGTINAGTTGITAIGYTGGALTINANNIISGQTAIIANMEVGSGININVAGDIVSGQGIVASAGDGDVNITANNITATQGNGAGISARGRNINISAAAIVSGFEAIDISAINDVVIDVVDAIGVRSGIVVDRFFGATGDTAITSTGTVTSIAVTPGDGGAVDINVNDIQSADVFDFGINVFGRNPSAISISATGDIVGGQSGGVNASNNGPGALTIDVVNVRGFTNEGRGIRAFNLGTDLSITATGDAAAISAINYGSGSTILTVNNVTEETDTIGRFINKPGHAIDAINGANAQDLTIVANGAVSGFNRGISAVQQGAGELNITLGSIGSVVGLRTEGIFATTAGTNATIQGSSGSITGAIDGIYLRTNGGEAVIQNLDSVSGQTGDAINVVSDGGNILIRNVDSIIGADTVNTRGDGIYAFSGGGDISIVDFGQILGSNGYGIYAGSSGGNLTITGNGDSVIAGGIYGVRASTGTGDINVSNVGSISGSGEGGLLLRTSSGDINVNNNGLNGGIFGNFDDGIGAVSSSGNITISGNGDISGSGAGIFSQITGAGNITIVDNGAITGTRIGIDVSNNGGDITIRNDEYVRGISSVNNGIGSTSIMVADVGSSNSGDALNITNAAGTQDLTIIASSTSNGNVIAINQGFGDTSLSLSDVNGSIMVEASPGGGTTDVSVANIDARASVGQVGLFVSALGNETTTITASGDITALASGVVVRLGSGDLDLDIGAVTATGATGGSNGVSVFSSSGFSAQNPIDAEAIDINVSGQIRAIGEGVSVSNFGSNRDINISTAGIESVGASGIRLLSLDGTKVITTNGQVDASVDGINAFVRSGTLTINTNDAISGDRTGITAIAEGPIVIRAGDASGAAIAGIYARGSEGDIDITSTGTVDGYTGVLAVNLGNSDLTVNANNVIGSSRDGLTALNGTQLLSNFNFPIEAVDLNVTQTGNAVGEQNGIRAENFGVGDTVLVANNVTGTTGMGIIGRNFANAGSLSITANGNVTGGGIGILADQRGSGTLAVTLGSDTEITGLSSAGIFATTTGTDANIIGSSNRIIGASSGIYLRTMGGNALIQNLDGLTGQNGDGIDVATTSGSITITDVGTVAGQGANGIIAFSNSGDIAIDSRNGEITGLYEGVAALSVAGNVSVSTADVSGTTYGSGIVAQAGGAVMVDSSAGSVSGAVGGIFAASLGDGDVSITAAAVNGESSRGILASTGMGSIFIEAMGPINAGYGGVVAANSGDNMVSIDVASVNGGTDEGISVVSGGDVDISASGAVVGDTYGILVNNAGAGNVDVSAANVTGTMNDAVRIIAADSADGLSINIGGDAIGGDNGIVAANSGNGGIDILVAGNVSGGSGVGIMAVNTGDFGVSINAAGISGGTDGVVISANNGASITTSGTVDGGTGAGIMVINGTAPEADAQITSDMATGQPSPSMDETVSNIGIVRNPIMVADNNNGLIQADINGSAAAAESQDVALEDTISNNSDRIANVEANVEESVGGNKTRLPLQAVEGSMFGGISSGDNATGLVRVDLFSPAVEMPIVAPANAGESGNIGEDNPTAVSADIIPIMSGANSNGKAQVDPFQQNDSNIDDSVEPLLLTDAMETDADPVSTGAGSDGISITASGAITGGTYGVIAQNFGTGDLNISTMSVAGLGNDGIRAINGDDSGNLSININGDVSGGINGLVAVNNGGGDTNILIDGSVTGTDGDGVMVIGGFDGGAVNLTLMGDVTGALNGIMANANMGDLTLNLAGDVSGGNIGILTQTFNGTNLNIAAGQTISGGLMAIATLATDDSAVSNDIINIAGTVNGSIATFAGNDELTLEAGGIINGAVMLGEGDDRFVMNGGSFGLLRGGEGRDTLIFNSEGGLLDGGDGTDGAIAEFEIIDFNMGNFVLDGLFTGLEQVNFNAGQNILLGTLGSDLTVIGEDVVLMTGESASIGGSLINNGTLSVNAGGVSSLAIDGDFTQSATGTLIVDVTSVESFDQIIVAGAVDIAGALVVNQTDFLPGEFVLIDGGTGLTGAFDSVTGLLSGGLLVQQTIGFDQANFDVLLTTSVNDADTLPGLSPIQAGVANALTADLSANGLDTDLGQIGLALGLVEDLDVLAAMLSELQPEFVLGGAQSLQNLNLSFGRTLTQQSNNPIGLSDPVVSASLQDATEFTPSRKRQSEIWGNLSFYDRDADTTATNSGFDTDGFEAVLGVSNIGSGPVTFGFAFGYADIDTSDTNIARDRAESDLFRLGANARWAINEASSGLNPALDLTLTAGFANNSFDRTIALTGLGMAVAQQAEADAEYYGAQLRFTIDGVDGKVWPVRPYIFVGGDIYQQDDLSFGAGTALGLDVEGFDLERFSLGYGIAVDTRLGKRGFLQFDAGGVHHSGDTQVATFATFTGSTVPTASTFLTSGLDIDSQYFASGGIGYELGRGWTVSVTGQIEFGDLEGFGGALRVGKRF